MTAAAARDLRTEQVTLNNFDGCDHSVIMQVSYHPDFEIPGDASDFRILVCFNDVTITDIEYMWFEHEGTEINSDLITNSQAVLAYVRSKVDREEIIDELIKVHLTYN